MRLRFVERTIVGIGVALLVLAVGVALLSLVGPASGADTVAIDSDHQLATESSIAEYRDRGVVSSELVQLDARITVAESSEDVGLSGATYTDFDTTYVRVEYREEISRTVRIYLPAEYAKPRPKEGLEAVDSDVTASLEPVEDREYTSVRVSFVGPTTATFELSREAGIVFDGRGEVRELVTNRTGVDAPSIRSEGQWSYVDGSGLSANRTVAIETNGQEVTLQYDRSEDVNTSEWRKVPDCGSESAPVCRFSREGDSGRVYVLSRSTEVPEVRYKHGNDPLAGLKSAIGDAGDAVGGLVDGVGGLLDWL